MTQRNPMNERYTSDKQLGKTRKSAASAKPSATRAATVRDPAPKTKKQKKAEAAERERRIAEKRGVSTRGRGYTSGQAVYDPPTKEYRTWNRRWWFALGAALVFMLPSFFLMNMGVPNWVIYTCLALAWVFLILALWIDLGKKRKIRKRYNAELAAGKSKEARAQQKARAAALREERKEAERKAEEAASAEPEKKGFFGRFGGKGKEKAAAEDAAESSAENAAASDKDKKDAQGAS